MDKRTFLKNSLIGTVSIAGPCAAYPVTLLHDEKEDNIEIIDEVRKQFENELIKMDLSHRAYNLCFKNNLYKKYAEETIEADKNSEYAYCMCRDCGSSREWAEKIIKNALYAYCMCRNCGSSREWAEKIIEADKNSKNSAYAYDMHINCGSSREWAEKIIEAEKNSEYAYIICKNCGSSREWAEKIIEERKSNYFAFYMYSDCGSSKEWHQSVRKSEYLEYLSGLE